MTAVITTEERDQGLQRVVGPVGLCLSIVTMVVGSAIFIIPAQLGATLGSLAPLAVLLVALAVGAIGVCMAEAGSRVPSSGGPYAYIAAAFGPCAGYVAAVLFWISNVLASGAVIAALGAAVASLAAPALRSAVQVAVMAAVVGVIVAVNLRGTAGSVRLLGSATVVKLLPLAIFVAVGAFAIDPHQFVRPGSLSASDLGRALVLTLFAFTGFECALCTGGEVREPTRTIPLALAFGLLVVTLLYTAIQLIAQGILGPALASSSTPLSDAMARIHPALGVLLFTGAAASMFGWLTGDLLSSPRLVFAFARDGWLPQSVGRLNARRVPAVATCIYAGIALVLALIGSFAALAEAASWAMAVIYAGSCAAAWQLSRRGIAHGGAPLAFRWIGAAAIAGGGAMLALLTLARRSDLAWIVLLIVASLIVFLIQSRLARRRLAGTPA